MIEFYRYSEFRYCSLVTVKTDDNRDNEAVAMM